MKIAFFGHKRIPSREGGVEIVVKELAVRMAEKGHAVTVFNRRGHNVAGRRFDGLKEEIKGVAIKTVPTVNGRGLAAASSSFFAALCSAFGRYDIVHIHSEGPAFFTFIPKLFKKKVVVTVHGLDHMRAKWGKFAGWYIKKGEENAVKYADEIIVLSKAAQNYFSENYGRDTVLIPNGCEEPTPVFADIIKQKWGLESRKYILYLGRIVPEKGLSYLITAYKNINTDMPLVIAGGASDTNGFFSDLREKCKDDSRIIFTDFVEGDTLCELYSNAYLYTLPSDLEGMPLCLLEALSYGNCALCSDIPELKETALSCAVYFAHGSAADLEDKLRYLIDNPKETEYYRTHSAEFVLEKYNWDDVTEKTLALYRR